MGLPKEDVEDDYLRRRLVAMGITDFEYVRADEDPHNDADASDGCGSTVKIKTLIWEAILEAGTATTTTLDPHVFAVALREEDRVDVPALQGFVRSDLQEVAAGGLNEGEECRLIVRLAETSVAERRTGYISGTIPPVGHVRPMPLYVDEGLVKGGVVSPPTSTSEPSAAGRDEGFAERPIEGLTLSAGSGVPGRSLRISPAELLRAASASAAPVRVRVRPISSSSASEGAGSPPPASAAGTGRPTCDVATAAMPTAMARTEGIDARARLLATTAKRKGRSEEIRMMIKECGDDFPLLMDVEQEGGINKNALHFAAWKGDLETILLLLDAGKSYGLNDLVNRFSTGKGNYGKTLIFYAITQCRDDVVLLLLSRGADLLIVNNKGQTPRSIATSHLGADTCRVLFDAEISQLQEAVAGSRGGFVNHRETHSDGERYCDLDPRFAIDETNMSDEITADLKVYNQLLQEDEGDDRICPPSAGGLETLLRTSENVRLPRVLQPTSRYVKRTKSDDPSSAPINGVPETINAKRSSPKKTLKAPRERKEIDISHLENLTFENLSPPDCDHTKSRTMLLVDDIESISKLLEMVERSVAFVELSNNTTGVRGELISDSIFVQCPWGLDCEWKPSRTKGSENPVSTLQLSTADDAFLVDLQTICQTEIKSSKIEMTEVEVLLSDCLTKLFSNPNIAILGFAVSQDIGKLAASFPHLPCFHLFQSVVDVHAVLLHFFPNIPKQEISSLQKVVAALLGKFLDKSQQCSDWSQRPLESAQIKYAMLDSAVLPTLLQLIMARNRASRSFSDDHFQKTPHLRSTFRFTHLDEVTFCAGDVNIPTAYLVEMGSVKKSLNLRMAKQLWPTGALAPGPPVQAPHGTATSQKTCKEIKEKSKVSSSKKRNRRARRSKTKMLTEIHGNFTTLPDPGSIVGYTKDSCVHSVLGDDFISSLPDDTILGFNRRGGVLEIANGWMLFVNFGQRAGSSNYSDYRNNFLNNGKQLTFSINRGRDIQASLLQFLMPEKSSTITNAASENSGKVVLFLRPSTREKFIFCGECTCDGLSETRGHIVDLVLNLLDFDALVNSDDGTASPYRQVVSSHEGMMADNEENRPETEEWEASFLMSHP